jgi:hypothetical protein
MSHAKAQRRVVFIDWLRVLAAFQMIQGHTLSAVLAPEHRAGFVHAAWSSARGLTSVAFLFAAGFSFYLAHASTESDAERARLARRRRSRRAVRLIALGYALHLPVAHWIDADAYVQLAAWRAFVAVDVLQCIGVSLLVLEVLAWACRSPARLGVVSCLVGVVLLALAPALSSLPEAVRPAFVANYFTSNQGSLFPLVPWAAHLFLGVACAAWLAVPLRMHEVLRLVLSAAVFGALALALGGSASLIADHLGRLSQVLLVCAALAQLTRHSRRVPTLVRRFGGESLFLYVFHVLVVYGAGVGLSDRIGPSLGLGPALAWTVAVLVATFGLALVYRRLLPGRLAGRAAAG